MGILDSKSKSVNNTTNNNQKITKTQTVDRSSVVNQTLDGGIIKEGFSFGNNALGFAERSNKESLTLVDKAITSALEDGAKSRDTLKNLLDKDGADKEQTVSTIKMLILAASFVLSIMFFFKRK